MPTKPNMRMGGVDTQGDRGVMASAMQAANIKASAQDQSGLTSLSANVLDWADDIQQEDRQKRLEARAEGRGIVKEGRATAAEEAKYERGAPEREAALGLTKAQTEKATAEAEYTRGGKSETDSNKWSEDKKYDIKAVDSQLKDLDTMRLELDPEKDAKQLAVINKSIGQLNERKRILRMTPEERKQLVANLKLKKQQAEEKEQREAEVIAEEKRIANESTAKKRAKQEARMQKVQASDAGIKRPQAATSVVPSVVPKRPVNKFSRGGVMNSGDIENIMRYK